MRRYYRPTPGAAPARRIVAALLLAIWLSGFFSPTGVGAAFASTDVIFLIDVSDSMDFPADIPADFPNRDEYRRAIGQLIAALERGEDERTISDMLNLFNATIQLSRLQGDVETYLQNNNIDLDDLSRLTAARNAVGAYLDLLELSKQNGTNDRVSLITFAGTATTQRPLGGDFAATRTALSGLSAGGGTNIGAGLQAALDQFARSPAPAGTRQQIILVTGGFTSEGLSSEQILSGPAQTAKSRNIPVYTVGLGLVPQIVDADFLADLARTTGGAYLYADSSDKLAGTLMTYQGFGSSRVLAKYDGTVSAGQSLRAGTVEVPSGSQSLRMAYRTTSSTALDISVAQPGGRVLTKADLGASLKKQGDTTLVTIANPPPGRWEITLARTDTGPDIAQYTVTASTEGTTDELPIALVAQLYESPEGWRPALVVGSAIIGIVGIFFVFLTFRGLFGRRTSTLGGCFSGCFTVVIVILIAVGWGGYWLWNQPFRP